MIINQVMSGNQVHLIPILCLLWYYFTGIHSIIWLNNKDVIFYDKVAATVGLLITPYLFRLLSEYIITFNNIL